MDLLGRCSAKSKLLVDWHRIWRGINRKLSARRIHISALLKCVVPELPADSPAMEIRGDKKQGDMSIISDFDYSDDFSFYSSDQDEMVGA
jgi:hypothetical protein